MEGYKVLVIYNHLGIEQNMNKTYASQDSWADEEFD